MAKGAPWHVIHGMVAAVGHGRAARMWWTFEWRRGAGGRVGWGPLGPLGGVGRVDGRTPTRRVCRVVAVTVLAPSDIETRFEME